MCGIAVGGWEAMDDRILDVCGAAELLNVSSDTVYRLAREAAIPARKVGRQWRFSKVALLAWLGDDASARATEGTVATGSKASVP